MDCNKLSLELNIPSQLAFDCFLVRALGDILYNIAASRIFYIRINHRYVISNETRITYSEFDTLEVARKSQTGVSVHLPSNI
jgi:hypothetical protein